MSRVYFHTKTQTEEVGGAERSWWGHLCWRLTNGVLDIADSYDDEILKRLYGLVPVGHYLRAPGIHDRESRFHAKHLLTAIHVSSGRDAVLRYKGHTIDTFGLQLNTALAVGSDAVRLAARLHGSCEIHCWVDEQNREWLASLIERGIEDGSLRRNFPNSNHQGYDSVLRLLRHPEHCGPVVTSYSVCESFPGIHLLDGFDGASDEERDAMYKMESGERWDLSMAALRNGAGRVGGELKPDNWQTFRFTHKLSALDLIAVDWEARLDRAIADGRI